MIIVGVTQPLRDNSVIVLDTREKIYNRCKTFSPTLHVNMKDGVRGTCNRGGPLVGDAIVTDSFEMKTELPD